jgi:hypothetical protein
MNAHGITPSLAAALRSLAQSQLQAQASRSIALDATAVAVVGVDAALVAIVASHVKPSHQLWSIALAMIVISVGLALRVLMMRGAERVGPIVARMLDDRAAHRDDEIEQRLVEDLATDMLANQEVLARKLSLVMGALISLGLAIACELGGLVG